MLSSAKKSRSFFIDSLLLAFGIGIYYLLTIGIYNILVPEEARYTEIAREMFESGNFITPHLNGIVFLDKPILFYWLESFAIKLFGLTEWALRFWPAVIGILGCLVIYFAGRVLFNRRVGILAALMLATAPIYYGLAHFANMDLEVAVFINASLCFFLIAQSQQNFAKYLSIFLIYGFAGLAFLTKGLIGIFFPLVIIGAWYLVGIIWNREKNEQKPEWGKLIIANVIGITVFLIIVMPWYILEQKANPNYFHYFFITQHFSRFLGQSFNNKQPIWFYVPIILIGILPWSIFIIKAKWQALKKILSNVSQNKKELFLLLWALIVFCFFSVPKSKLIGYILPVIPPIILLISIYLDSIWRNSKIFIILLLTAVLITLAGTYTIGKMNPGSIKPLALKFKATIKDTDEVVMFHEYYQDLPLYLDRKVFVVADWQNISKYWSDDWEHLFLVGLQFNDNEKNRLLTDLDLQKLWSSKKHIWVILKPKDLKLLKSILTLPKDFSYQGSKAILIKNY